MTAAVRNPFRHPFMARAFDDMVRAYTNKRPILFRLDGTQNTDNSWGSIFWRGYHGNPGPFVWDAASKRTGAYAIFRAGDVVRTARGDA